MWASRWSELGGLSCWLARLIKGCPIRCQRQYPTRSVLQARICARAPPAHSPRTAIEQLGQSLRRDIDRRSRSSPRSGGASEFRTWPHNRVRRIRAVPESKPCLAAGRCPGPDLYPSPDPGSFFGKPVQRCAPAACVNFPVPASIGRPTPACRFLECFPWSPSSIDPHVPEVNGHVIDAARGRSNPVGKLARLDDLPHKRFHESMVGFSGQPFVAMAVPLHLGHHPSVYADKMSGKDADLAMKSLVRQCKTERDPVLFGNTVPAVEPRSNLFIVVVSQTGIHRRERWNFRLDDLAIFDFEHAVFIRIQFVIVILTAFQVSSLKP